MRGRLPTALNGDTLAEAETLAARLNASSQLIEAVAIRRYSAAPAVQIRDLRRDSPLAVYLDVEPGRWKTLSLARVRKLYPEAMED